jgi:hypothetical protein
LFDLVFADAVLLRGHSAGRRVDEGGRGRLARKDYWFTVKEGDGEAWTTAKTGRAPYFRYRLEPAMRTHSLPRAGSR